MQEVTSPPLQYVTGYQEHLTELTSTAQRPAMFDVYTVLGQDTCFALPGNQKPERRRKRPREAMSLKRASPRVPRTPSLRVDHTWKQKETTVWLGLWPTPAHVYVYSVTILLFAFHISWIHNILITSWSIAVKCRSSVVYRVTWCWSARLWIRLLKITSSAGLC